MPISAIDGCDASHWSDVKQILFEAIEGAGFLPNLVSDADEVGVIQKRIISNLYEYEMVVCDVSAKNPNVMFELGIRLAFDKPTIIIKDDRTSYTFDTASIEHLEYPRDLRFTLIREFKEKLSSKIRATYEKSIHDKNYTTFLKHFGEFKATSLDKLEVTTTDIILDELKHLRSTVSTLITKDRAAGNSYNAFSNALYTERIPLKDASLRYSRNVLHAAREHPAIISAELRGEENEVFLIFRTALGSKSLVEQVKAQILNEAKIMSARTYQTFASEEGEAGKG